jgi:hypothetical protein
VTSRRERGGGVLGSDDKMNKYMRKEMNKEKGRRKKVVFPLEMSPNIVAVTS